jgi:hypothetical protein
MDLQKALEWYAHLARQPGWKSYVWHRVNEMAREHPAVFGDLPALLLEEMKRGRDDSHSDDPAQEAVAGQDADH